MCIARDNIRKIQSRSQRAGEREPKHGRPGKNMFADAKHAGAVGLSGLNKQGLA
jgi:hypothetical protein